MGCQHRPEAPTSVIRVTEIDAVVPSPKGSSQNKQNYLLNTIQVHWSFSCPSPYYASTLNSCTLWASESVRQSPNRLEYLNSFLPPLLLSSFLVLIYQSSLASTSPNHLATRPSDPRQATTDHPPLTLASGTTTAIVSECQARTVVT